MRDPDRLDAFYEELKRIHKEQFPDLRFGQLFSNMSFWLQHEKFRDIFYVEDNRFIDYLKEYKNMQTTTCN